MIFDTHAHYNDRAFEEDRALLLEGFPDRGIGGVVNAAASYRSLSFTKQLTEQYDFIYGAYGIHPSEIDTVPGVVKISDLTGMPISEADETDHAGDGKNDGNIVQVRTDSCRTEESFSEKKSGSGAPPVWFLEELRDLCRMNKAVAVGEIGLDYHWDKDNKKQQIAWFECQIEQARQLQLPVIIHSREAAEDTLTTARRAMLGDVGGVMHCFSYSVEMAREYLNMGLYLGIGGVLTFKNARKLREVVAYAPMEQLVIETDCPYLAPTPHRGERNCSLYLPLVIEAVADIKGMTPEEVEGVTWENAKRLYGL
ncbi:MAG: TatD family hydrolase [Eubacterium sp.]|nr:TatD family hydrolase [Eubacterium sp.]